MSQSNIFKLSKLYLTTASFFLVITFNVYSATNSNTFTVTANINPSCNINASNLNFGSYEPLSSTPNDASSTINVTCTNGTNYSVGLNAGTAPGATTSSRAMVGPGSSTLNYNLYSDSSRTNLWGNIGETSVISRTGNGTSQSVTVYGRIPISQLATSGGYSDTITATVNF